MGRNPRQEYADENAMFFCGIKDTPFRSHSPEALIDKRNQLLMVGVAHVAITFVMLALTGVRRAILAMIVNFFILIALVLGLYAMCKLRLSLIRIFYIGLGVLILLSIVAMIIETLIVDKDERKWIYIVNIPILLDILAFIAYICLYKATFKIVNED